MRLKSTLAKKVRETTGQHFKVFIEQNFDLSAQSFYIRLKKGNVRMAEVAYLLLATGLTFDELFGDDPAWKKLRETMQERISNGRSVYLRKKKGPGNKKKSNFSFIEI